MLLLKYLLLFTGAGLLGGAWTIVIGGKDRRPNNQLSATISSLLWLKMPAGDLSVHRVRRKINIAGPSDRAVIDEDLLEKLDVQQRRKSCRQLLSR